MVAEGEQPFTEAGKRLARRHRIANAGRAAFKIVKGEVACKVVSSAASPDDEIPF